MNQILMYEEDPKKKRDNAEQLNNIYNNNIEQSNNMYNNNIEQSNNMHNNNIEQSNNIYNSNIEQTNNIYSEGRTIQKLEIKKVIRIFCIIIIIFSIVLCGKSLYTFIKNNNNQKDNPIVDISKMGKEATISITTQKPIKEYSYQWNKEGKPQTEQGNGRLSLEKVIQIPNGNNILNITVTDYYGNKTKYFKQYIYESTDIQKPTINLATVGNKLKITAQDNVEMLYMTYNWNNQDVIRVDVTEEDKKTIEVEIEVPKGQNQLNIIAVDKEENKEKRTENIIGDDKPTFDIQTDGKNLVIIAKDDEGISRIVAKVDDEVTDSGDTPINQTDITAKLPISPGTHTITVTVTNVNGLSETKTVTHTF